nr:unnamed protein product [Spirometra erinaceieuropaei]
MDKFPPEVQHILAPASDILSATQLTQMADRIMEMHGFSKLSLSALSTPSTHPTSLLSQLEIELSRLAADIASLQKQTVSPSFRSQPKPSTPHLQSSHSARPNAAAICWYHTTFGVKARRCISPCSFTSKQSKRVKPINPNVSAANLFDSSNSGRTFYVCETATRRRFLVDTGAQISVVPLTAADRRSPSPGLHLQAIFVIADVPHPILDSDFLAEFDLLVDCRRARLLDRTTGLFVRGLSRFTAPTNLSVLDTDIASPFRQLLLSHPNIINPQFRSGEVQHDVVHHIRTSGPPVFARPRRLAPERFQAAKAEFGHMVQPGIIRPSDSPWASPLHMVPKATSGDPVATIEPSTALPFLIVAPEDIPKTAVTTPFGLFEFVRMPSGLRNAAQTFQRFIDHVLLGLPFVYAYIDDLLVASRNEEEHKQHLVLLFDCLDKFGVVINPSKCVLGVPSLEFLGRQVDSEGSLEQTGEALTAFERIKNSLADATLLTHPAPEAQLSLMVDASTVAVGAILQQHLAGSTQPLAFFSKKLLPAETRYSTFGRELLAIYLAVKHFRHFLEGRDFTVFTDHKPLTFALRSYSDKYNPMVLVGSSLSSESPIIYFPLE